MAYLKEYKEKRWKKCNCPFTASNLGNTCLFISLIYNTLNDTVECRMPKHAIFGTTINCAIDKN